MLIGFRVKIKFQFLSDHVSIVEPKEDVIPTTPYSEQKGGKVPEPAAAAPAVPVA